MERALLVGMIRKIRSLLGSISELSLILFVFWMQMGKIDGRNSDKVLSIEAKVFACLSDKWDLFGSWMYE